jgi:hypothetical protein
MKGATRGRGGEATNVNEGGDAGERRGGDAVGQRQHERMNKNNSAGARRERIDG